MKKKPTSNLTTIGAIWMVSIIVFYFIGYIFDAGKGYADFIKYNIYTLSAFVVLLGIIGFINLIRNK